MRRRLVVLALVAGCGVRTPTPIDVAGLVRVRGEVEARRDLAIRVLEHPGDVQARLALAELADKLGRPSEAIEQLEAVIAINGPIGVRWHDADRSRYARLVLARAKVRLARGAATALANLELAQKYGATVAAQDIVDAKLDLAIARLRHADAGERTKGRSLLKALAGKVPAAEVIDRPADFGAWLWSIGAKREAYEQLTSWHASTKPPRDARYQAAYLRALAWWSPVWLGEVPPPPDEDLVGPEKCLFPNGDCDVAPAEAPPLPPVAPSDDPAAAAVALYVRTRFPDAPDMIPLAKAFAHDGAIAERIGRDLVAQAPDAAVAHAAVGAAFDALHDPGRARNEWQAAVDGSAEPAFIRGLAEAAARGGDGDATLIFATTAAAASGDPAVVWLSVARELSSADHDIEALTAARNAIDLAGPEVLSEALDTAIAASTALGREEQADSLLARRALLPRGSDDVPAALAAHRERPTAATVARLWVTSRAHPRDLESRLALVAALERDDPRRAVIAAELVAFAAHPDASVALTAIGALR